MRRVDEEMRKREKIEAERKKREEEQALKLKSEEEQRALEECERYFIFFLFFSKLVVQKYKKLIINCYMCIRFVFFSFKQLSKFKVAVILETSIKKTMGKFKKYSKLA